MDNLAVLVLDEQGSAPPELLAALVEAGASVTLRRPEEVLNTEPGQLPVPAALLVSAAIPPHIVRAVGRYLVGDGDEPLTVVFTERDFGFLDPHLASGFEYLVPPFLASLIRHRLTSNRERAALSFTSEELQAHAELLSYERELEIGREIQLGFLPEALPDPEGWDVGVRFRPARMVAGDFYDVFELVERRRLAFVVADVCDKGVGAALFMALIRSLLRHTAEQSGLRSLIAADLLAGEVPLGHQPDYRTIPAVGATPLLSAVAGTNTYLTSNHLRQGYFATLFFCVLDPVTGSLVYINGGHNPPVLVRSGGTDQQLLEPTGPAVGVIPNTGFSFGYAQLDPGDTLYIYTDGVTEARAPSGDFFGDQQLSDLLVAPVVSGEELLERVDRAIRTFTAGADQSDDITMMVVHRLAEAS